MQQSCQWLSFLIRATSARNLSSLQLAARRSKLAAFLDKLKSLLLTSGLFPEGFHAETGRHCDRQWRAYAHGAVLRQTQRLYCAGTGCACGSGCDRALGDRSQGIRSRGVRQCAANFRRRALRRSPRRVARGAAHRNAGIDGQSAVRIGHAGHRQRRADDSD